MTNREKFLKNLAEMTDERLAEVVCEVSWCSECIVKDSCFDYSGIKEVLVGWLAKGESEE